MYGNLYLTDKESATGFSDEHEALAEALALAAGIAIENTRLHDRVRVMRVPRRPGPSRSRCRYAPRRPARAASPAPGRHRLS